jgi:hypothetical protein
MAKRSGYWIGWGVLTVGIGGYLALGLLPDRAVSNRFVASARTLLMPGKTSHGHYQIELKCEACHSEAFGGRDSLQEACVKCHGTELKDADDKHPKSKFTDPRNADRAAKLDATYCVTCHVEHRPEITKTMGVTVANDVCFHCHSGENDIAKERPSHAGMKFDTCTNAGCHNFHDNRALYEDFLLKHLHEAPTQTGATLPVRNYASLVATLASYPADKYPVKPLARDAQDAPATAKFDSKLHDDWFSTAHAKAGVNCSGCHVDAPADKEPRWSDRPDHRACARCHSAEAKGFLAGKHGMRIEQGIKPMTPGLARQPMKADVRDKPLVCTTCHSAHRFDTRQAAVEACMGCHDDTHTRAYKASSHYALWQRELAGAAPPGSGVSCASCHLPRVDHRSEDGKRVLVQHNQNDNLRPNEKMIRPVCMNCHGLGFSIDALADAALIARNFKGQPQVHVRGLEMAEARMKEQEEKKRQRKGADTAKRGETEERKQ